MLFSSLCSLNRLVAGNGMSRPSMAAAQSRPPLRAIELISLRFVPPSIT